MISNQILQNTIDGLKSITRVDLCVMDADGKEVASTAEMKHDAKTSADFALSPADSQEIQGYQYFKIFDEQQLEYIRSGRNRRRRVYGREDRRISDTESAGGIQGAF